MMKTLTIAWKDTLIRFRDRNAIILMILAPLALSWIIGSAFGGFIQGSDPTPFDAIRVIVINEDDGELGDSFLEILQSEAIAEVLAVETMTDLAEAREIVQAGDARTAVYIPSTFTAAIQNQTGDDTQAVVQFYADPGATLTPNIARGIVLQVLNNFNSAGISGQIAIEQLVMTEGTAVLAQMETIVPVLDSAIGAQAGGETAVTLNTISVGETAGEVDISPFAFFAPSMGILFLMFSMMDGTRAILEEERAGTLGRLISTPTSYTEILLGKIGGVFLTGLLQFSVFVIASRFLFQLNWGRSLLGLVMMTLATVLSLTSLGAFIAAFARDLNQANILGTVVTLVFAALGGNFVPAQNFPPFLQQLSKITITRWGLDGFSDLTIRGLGAEAVLLETAVLLGIGAVFFVLALSLFHRRVAK